MFKCNLNFKFKCIWNVTNLQRNIPLCVLCCLYFEACKVNNYLCKLALSIILTLNNRSKFFLVFLRRRLVKPVHKIGTLYQTLMSLFIMSACLLIKYYHFLAFLCLTFIYFSFLSYTGFKLNFLWSCHHILLSIILFKFSLNILIVSLQGTVSWYFSDREKIQCSFKHCSYCMQFPISDN